MAYSRVSYTGTGSVLNATFPFPYLDKTDIKVLVNDVSVPFTFLNNSTVTPTVAPAAGAIIQVRRITQKTSVPVNFTDGSVLLEQDLDLLGTYSLYLAQETQDDVETALALNFRNEMDARNRRIVRLGDAVQASDAVNKGQLDATAEVLQGNINNIAGSAAAAAASAETAKHIYSGTYAADPLTRPNGSVRQVGDSAFIGGLERRWNGATWQASDISTANLAAAGGAGLMGFTPSGLGAVARTAQDKMRESVSVFDYMTDVQKNSVRARDLLVDVSNAIQNALNYAMSIGGLLEFPGGSYRVNQTLNLLNEKAIYSFGMQGQNGNSTRLHFFNAIPMADMFYIGADVNYLAISDLEFIDTTAQTSRCFRFFDNTTSLGAPSWKHLIRNVRISGFKEGVRFDGGTTPGADTHESEVMFLHSKFRNCETSLIYNNVQAVNHQLIGLDIENDAAADIAAKWVMIKFERGAHVNHVGGSAIGFGPYVQYKYPSDGTAFEQTSQFRSDGVRLEARGNGPFIDHDITSVLTVSSFFRLIFDGLSVVSYSASATPILARVGGQTLVVFKECGTNAPMDVQAYMTTNLTGNAQYGGIFMERCSGLNYKRVSNVAAYGSAGVDATNYRAIPAEILTASEGAAIKVEADGYVTLIGQQQTIYCGGLQSSQIKTLVYSKADSPGFGSGENPATLKVNLPMFGRPCKFRILRDAFTTGSPFVLTLVFVVAGVDYTVATITPGAANCGHFEANIALPSVMTEAINDGGAWDGKMKIIKSGSATGFTGLLMVDYM